MITREIFKGKRLEVTDPYVSPEHKATIESAQKHLNEYEDNLLAYLHKQYPAASSINCKYSMAEIIRLYRGDVIRMKMIESISLLRMCYERPRFITVDEWGAPV